MITPSAEPSADAGLGAESVLVIGRTVTTLDGSRHFALGPREQPKAIDGLRVATVEYADDNTSTHLRVWNVETGRVVAELTQPIAVTDVVIASDSVYFTGFEPSGPPWEDPGVKLFSLTDQTVEQVTPPRDGPDQWSRALLFGSPSGASIASQASTVDNSGQPTGKVYADVTTNRSKQGSVILNGTNLFALTDTVVLTRDGESVVAYRIGVAGALWKVTARGTAQGYLTTDGQLIQPLFDQAWQISIIDAADGAVTRTYPLAGDGQIARSISSDRYVVFQPLDGAASFTYLDLETGTVGTAEMPGADR